MSEPVSEAKFPARWENTGNGPVLALRAAERLEITQQRQWLAEQFPKQPNRQFYFG
jgi:hypothetical protein